MNQNPHLRQKFSFSILFLMGATLLIGSSYRAEQDVWISMFIASTILILWCFVLAQISVLFPGKDIFALLKLFPKWISKLLTGVVTLYCFDQAVITIRVYSGFVRIVSLPNTSILILLALICLVVFFFLRKGDFMLYRFSYLTLLPIVFLVVILFLFLAPMFRTENLFPIFYKNTSEVLFCATENFSFPFGNAFLLLGLTFSIDDRKKERKTWFSIAVCSSVLSFIIVIQNVLLLGGTLCKQLDFPYNFAASLVNVGDFFSRIEVFASLFFFLSAIVRTAYLMKLVLRGLEYLIPVGGKSLAFPVLVCLCGYSAIAFDNTNSVFNYLKVFPYIALPVQLGIPLMIWFFGKRKGKRNQYSDNTIKSSVLRLL